MPVAFVDSLDDSHALIRQEPIVAASPPRSGVAEIDEALVAFYRFEPSKKSDVPSRAAEILAERRTSPLAQQCWLFLTERVLAAADSRGSQRAHRGF